MNTKIQQIIQDSIAVKQQLLEQPDLLKTIESVVYVMVQAFKNGHRVWFCGNGGSAADAQHLAAEFSGRFIKIEKHFLLKPFIAIHPM